MLNDKIGSFIYYVIFGFFCFSGLFCARCFVKKLGLVENLIVSIALYIIWCIIAFKTCFK